MDRECDVIQVNKQTNKQKLWERKFTFGEDRKEYKKRRNHKSRN
jgi:hypothetical protein